MPIEEKFIIDDTGAIESFDSIIRKALEAQNELGKVGSIGTDAMQDLVNSNDKAAKEINDTSKSVKKQNAELKQTESITGKLGKNLKDRIRDFKVFGVSLGSISDNLKKVNKGQKDNEKSGSRLGGVFNRIKGIGLGVAIGAIGLALTGLVSIFTRTQAGADKFNQVLAGGRAVIDVLLDRVTTFGKALSNLFSGNFRQAGRDLVNTFKGVGEEIAADAAAAFQLEKRTQALRDSNRELSLTYARQRAEIEELKNIGEDTTKSIEERQDALRRSIALENDLAAARKKNALENLDIIAAQNALSESSAEDLDRQAAAAADLFNIDAENAARKREQQNKLNALVKEEQTRRSEAAEEARRALEEQRAAFESNITSLEKQIQAQNLANLSGEERVEAEKKIALEQIALLEQETIQVAKTEADKQQARGLANQLRELAERDATARIEQIRTDAAIKEAEDIKKRNAEALEDQKRLNEAITAEIKRALDERKQDAANEEAIDLSEVELLQESTDQLLTLEQFKEQRRLEIRKKGLQARLAIAQDEFGPDSPEVQLIRNSIAKIDQELTAFEAVGVGQRFKNFIKSTFKLNDEDIQILGESINTIVNSFVEGITAATEAEIAANEAAIQSLDKKIAAQNKAFEEQKKRDERGLASSVKTEEKKLAALQKERDKAEKKRLALQKKAARQQLIVDLATQVSSLATAAAKVFAAESGKGLVGVILAISAVATLFAAFAKAKSSAKKAAAVPKLRKGRRLDGAKHEQDGIDIIMRNPATGQKRVAYEAEDREWLIGTKPSIEHDDHLAKVNAGVYSGSDIDALIQAGMVADNTKKTKKRIIQARKSDNNQIAAAIVQASKDNSMAIVQAIKEQPTILSEGQNLIIKEEGNTKRIQTINVPAKE